MEYRPLSALVEELRLIAILPEADVNVNQTSASPHQPSEDLVHCTLQHYPLTFKNGTGESTPRHFSTPLNWTITNGEPSGTTQQEISTRWRFHWGDFLALSYTWGSPEDKKSIVINGRIVQVQANLEAALRVLRAKEPMRYGYRIWVDALCINQQDLDERSREVRRMRMIYTLAADVVIWLGVENDESNKAMDLIKILSKSCKNGTAKELGKKLRENPGYLGHRMWLALSRLLQRGYWDRMWIIQELCLAGGRAPILCGNKCVTWEEFFAALYTFGRGNIDIYFSCIDRERKVAGLGSYGLNRNKIIHVNEEHKKQAGLAEPQYMALLDLARRSDASNPVDKNYGILGLMDPRVSSRVVSDYTLNVGEVNKDFAMQYIVATNGLEILEQCRLHKSHLPSWAPDWTFKEHYRLHSGRRSSYKAGGDSITSFSFEHGGDTLEVDGIVVGTIDGLGQAYYEYDKELTDEDSLVQPKNCTIAYCSESETKDALWRTLTGDRTFRGQPAPDEYSEILNLPLRREYINILPSRGARAFSRFLTQSERLTISGQQLGTYFTNRSKEFPSTQVDVVEKIWRFTRTRRLIVLLDGRIGMAPNEARRGDKLCVFLGSDVPFLVRPGLSPNDPVELVGGCYVHGFMAGEALQRVSNGLARVEKIAIS